MYAEESISDILFMILYGGVAMLTLAAALYLWLRRTNAFMPEMETPGEVRRRTAAFLFAATASHVWWLVVGNYWLTEERLVRDMALMALDHLTLVPLAMAVLLCMLQDRRRRLWPWIVAQVPIVGIAVAGIAMGDARSVLWMNGWQTVVIAAFVVRYFLAQREYNRWLLDNYADLEHKDIWRSLLVAVGLCVVYEVYCNNPGMMAVEYLSQVFTIAVALFLVWRVETLQRLALEEEYDEPADATDADEADATSATPKPKAKRPKRPKAAADKKATTVTIDFGPQLRDRCEETGLYLKPDLRMEQLADVLETNRTYLGTYFARTGTTYNDYINQLRIAHFERLYAKAKRGHASAKAKNLSAESGFSSYSTFIAAFKKHRGITVAEWMRRQR